LALLRGYISPRQNGDSEADQPLKYWYYLLVGGAILVADFDQFGTCLVREYKGLRAFHGTGDSFATARVWGSVLAKARSFSARDINAPQSYF
jgi:hypothetical protein